MNIDRQEISRLAGWVGAAMMIAGYVRYAIQGLWTWINLSLLIAGGVLLLASIVFNFRSIVALLRRRSGKLATNTAMLSVAVIGILGILNFLGYRHHKRIDLTAEKLYTLSDQTKKILSGLQKDVKIVKFDKMDDQRLSDLMAEFKYLSKRFSYERVDPQQKPEVVRQFGLQQIRFGETIVSSGGRTERLQNTDEQDLINAILKVTRDRLKRICFVEGHGEKSLTSSEGDGYSTVDRVLKNENYEVKPVNLATSSQVPAECDVLVVAGPRKPFLPQEAAAIGKNLDEGGKVALLIDPNTDPQLDDVLKARNITLGNDTIIASPGTGVNLVTPVVTEYASHPITKDMRGTQTLFPEVRSVKVGNTAGSDMSFTEIIKTLKDTWAETDLKGQKPEFDASKDTKGPVTIGAALSKKVGDKETRLVVIGDSDFAANGGIRFVANGDFFFNTVNWLAQDEDLISIRPKSAVNRSVTMTQSQQYWNWWLTVILMPLAVIGSGAYIWWKRR